MPPTLLRLLTNPSHGITHIPLTASPYKSPQRHHVHPTNGIYLHNLHNLQYTHTLTHSLSLSLSLSHTHTHTHTEASRAMGFSDESASDAHAVLSGFMV